MGKHGKSSKEKLVKMKKKLKKVPDEILDKLSTEKSDIENADELRTWMRRVNGK